MRPHPLPLPIFKNENGEGGEFLNEHYCHDQLA